MLVKHPVVIQSSLKFATYCLGLKALNMALNLFIANGLILTTPLYQPAKVTRIKFHP